MSAGENLWPSEMSIEEVRSPQDILNDQCKYLEQVTKGRLGAQVVRTDGQDRIVLGLQVESTKTKRSVRLLEVSHRHNFEYPAHISILVERLPDYLKDRIWKEPSSSLVIPFRTEGYWVDNPWVTASPEEFTDKLRDVLERATVKAAVLSLLASPPVATLQPESTGESQVDETDASG